MSHAYSYSWALNPCWSRVWSKRDEILEYIHDVARNQLQIHNHTSFNTQVVTANFENGIWTLHLKDLKTGATFEINHTFLMSATGQLNIPFIPKTLDETKSNFTNGPQFHSARWNKTVDLSNKRVACIGTGASAIQFVPEIAPKVKELLVFQRSPGWIIAKHDYPYSTFIKGLFKAFPLLLRLYRYYFFAWMDSVYLNVIPNSAPQPSKINSLITKFVASEMSRHLNYNQELCEKLIPKDTLGCKRLLLSDEWLSVFHRENVKLITDPAQEILKDGIRCHSGKEVHDIDVIIYATGFDTNAFLKTLEIKVNNQTDLHRDIWKDIPRAYRGITVADVPNFTMCYAANTNVNHSSIISIIECEVEHFGQLVTNVVENKKKQFLVKKKAYLDFNKEEQDRLKTTAFNGNCTSWYKKNKNQIIVNNYHGTMFSFWQSTRVVNWSDYEFS